MSTSHPTQLPSDKHLVLYRIPAGQFLMTRGEVRRLDWLYGKTVASAAANAAGIDPVLTDPPDLGQGAYYTADEIYRRFDADGKERTPLAGVSPARGQVHFKGSRL